MKVAVITAMFFVVAEQCLHRTEDFPASRGREVEESTGGV